MSMRPAEVVVSKPSVSGTVASFTVTGSTPSGEKATGSVKMIIEEGKWRVLEDKWEFVSK